MVSCLSYSVSDAFDHKLLLLDKSQYPCCGEAAIELPAWVNTFALILLWSFWVLTPLMAIVSSLSPRSSLPHSHGCTGAEDKALGGSCVVVFNTLKQRYSCIGWVWDLGAWAWCGVGRGLMVLTECWTVVCVKHSHMRVHLLLVVFSDGSEWLWLNH